MADKKFLGLGFTFSATDKGLQTKLQGISDVIQDISAGLDKVNKQFDKMTGTKTVNVKSKFSGASSMKKPSMRQASSGGDPGWDKLLAYLSKNQAKSTAPRARQVSGKFSDVESSLSKKARSQILGLGSDILATGGNFKSFTTELRDLDITLTSTGRLTSASVQKLLRLGKATFDLGKDTESLNRQFKSLQVGLHAIGEYFKDIGNSANEFLKSLGVDFGKIIPEQFKAAAKFAGSIIAGPFKGVSKAFSFLGKKSKAEELQDKGNAFIEMASNRLGGPGRKNKNIFTQLEALNKKQQDDKKGGLMQGLFDLFKKPLSLLAAGFAGLKAFKLFNLGSLIKDFGGVRAMLTRFGIGALQAVSAIFVLSAAFTGLWKGLVKSFDSLKNGMILLWQGVQNLFEGIWALGKAIGGTLFTSIGDWITKMAEGSTVLTFLVDAFTGLWKTIQKGWENIGELIGSVLGLLGDKLGGLLFNWGDKLKDVAKSFSAPTPSTVQPNNVVRMSDYQKDLQTGLGAVADKTDDLRESLVKGAEKNLKAQSEQSFLQKDTNDKLERLIGLMDNGNKQMPSINLMNNFDARKFGLSVRQDENDQIAASKF